MRIRWWKKGATGAPETDEVGRWGEAHAERLLKKKGYKVLGRRVRMGRHDELDLVMRTKDVLVFVEVKTRKNVDFGRPVSAVNRHKRVALSRAAMRYLRRLRAKPPYFRFDVVEVIGEVGDEQPAVRHIENAFPLERDYRVYW